MIDPIVNKELKQKFSPEGSPLRNMQLKLLDMLIWIDKICKENNIDYWISSGTCLGAIRHGGFIPWDDDVDIEMTFNNYIRFEKILDNMEKCPYILQSYSKDKNYFHSFSKLRNEKYPISESNEEDQLYKYKGIYIDIFIMTPKIPKLISKIGGYWWFKCRKIIQSNKLNKYITHYWLFPLGYYLIKPTLMLLSPKKKDEYSIIFGEGIWKTRKIVNIQKTTPIMFEGYQFLGPNNPEAYLRDIYGDYEVLKIYDQHTKNAIPCNNRRSSM